MKRRRIIVFVLLVAALPLAGCAGSGFSGGTTETSTVVSYQKSSHVVSSTGEVRPVRWASLSFPVEGRVQAILVEEGQVVTTGQPLVEIDAIRLARAVSEAQASLSAAEADLALLKAGAHPQDLVASEQAAAGEGRRSATR